MARGTTMSVAGAFVSKSRQTRRGPQNPNRQRQPTRKGANSQHGRVNGVLNSRLKGPDKGKG